MKNDTTQIEFRILIKESEYYYYIIKVEHHDSETLCFYPDAGFHFTEHKSGEAHVQGEKSKKELQMEYQLLLLLAKQDNDSVMVSGMRLPKI